MLMMISASHVLQQNTGGTVSLLGPFEIVQDEVTQGPLGLGGVCEKEQAPPSAKTSRGLCLSRVAHAS